METIYRKNEREANPPFSLTCQVDYRVSFLSLFAIEDRNKIFDFIEQDDPRAALESFCGCSQLAFSD